MKIKRFVAKDIRQAMRMVKDELGADAVIMSNKSVDEGVEIVAARDFDEQAIRNNLSSQSSSTQASAAKDTAKGKIELRDFDAEKNNLHVVSSPRKRATEGVAPKRPLQRNADKYLGYAEKVGVATEEKNVSIKKQNHHLNPQRPARRTQQFNNVVREEIKQQSASMPEQFMQEMRKEINDLKLALDTKLSEVSWNQGRQGNSVRDGLLQKLGLMGFSRKLSTKVANRLEGHTDLELAFEKAKEMLVNVLPVIDDDLLENGGVVALVGPTGVGKTTTIAKLAAQFILKHGSGQVALITTDNYRIGAHEQLSTYGRLLDVPVCVATNAEELREHIDSFDDKRLVLIDTAGMSQRDMRLGEQIQTLQQDNVQINTYLVMSAATQYKAMNEIINAFKVFKPKSSILTKLDETVAQGSTLSASIEQQLPISFMTNGQQVPEDIYFPDAYTLIEECVAEIDEENDYNEALSSDSWMAEGYA